MGKLKHYMRSMRSRFSPPRYTPSDSSSLSSTTESRLQSADTDVHGDGSSSTIFTLATLSSHTLTPSPTPTLHRRPRTETTSPAPIAFSPKERGADAQRVSLDAHAVLQVDIALLEFERKLPLEELRMIGRGLAFSHFSDYGYAQGKHGGAPDDIAVGSLVRSETVSLASTISDSSSSCVRNTLRRAGHDPTRRQCRDAEVMAGDEARTLSLGTMGSDWTCSFTGFSGWHAGGDDAQSQLDDGEAARGDISSSRGEVGSGDEVRVLQSGTNSLGAKEGRSLREDYRYHATHEALAQNPGDQRELATSSPTAADSCDLFLEYIGLPILDECLHKVNDGVFDELPDWSDVENDSEYNYLEGKKNIPVVGYSKLIFAQVSISDTEVF